MRRRILRLTLVALATLAFAATGHPSASAACPPLDAACRLDEAMGTGEGPVDDTIDPIVDPIVDDVFDRVDDIVGGGPIDLPDPIDGGDGGSHGGGPPVGDGPPGTPNPAARGGLGAVGGRSLDGPGLTGLPGPAISAASGTVDAGRTSGNRFGEALGGVARSLAIVVALFGLAVAFVAIQDRFDRSDPRLALAPVESDVVEFA